MLELTELSAGHPGLVRELALNPGNAVESLEPVIHLADLVLVLAVDPGWSGQAPAPTTARRVASVRALASRTRSPVRIGIDGGLTLANAADVAALAPDIVVAGSAIFSTATRSIIFAPSCPL